MANALPMFFLVAAGVCLSLVLLAFWQSIRGLFVRNEGGLAAESVPNVARQALLREKASLLGALREVRLEHELGKVSDDDFRDLDSRYRNRAREVLRELDEEIEPMRDRARAMIEAAIAEQERGA